MSKETNKDPNNKKNTEKGGKVRLSLVYRLNSRFIVRLFVLFLIMDIFLAVSIGTGVVLRAEETVKQAVAVYEQQGLPGNGVTPWTEAAGYQMRRVSGGSEGLGLPQVFQDLLPQYGQQSRRALMMGENDELIYRYDFIDADQAYSVQVQLDKTLDYIWRIGRYLLIGELLVLLIGFLSGARLIRRSLQPIADFAETAKSLNRNDMSFSVDKMESLADRLDAINAARLDTRIPVDGTQDELRSLAEAINGLLDRINEAYVSQARFVSDASHELRTPISVIQGYANMLDRWGKSDETTLQESIDAIMEETANMKGLIEQLLFLARGDNDSMPLQLETFDLSELAEEVYRETKMIDSGHEYEARFTPVAVAADKGLIKQAVRILIDNAIKYTNTGGKIILFAGESADAATITVQDEGIGIPPEAVPLIFERFYRADSSRARATGGAGLGLSIAKWIVERHGGHMEVLSRQEFGTRITVALPKVERG